MIDHFIRAHSHMYDQALSEIKNGKKVSHWIWYIFPQMIGLGKSGMSQTYALKNREHAKEYMNNELLRNHYLECCQAIIDSGKSVYEIFGNDAVKVHSSIMLMNSVLDDSVIKEVIRRHGWK